MTIADLEDVIKCVKEIRSLMWRNHASEAMRRKKFNWHRQLKQLVLYTYRVHGEELPSARNADIFEFSFFFFCWSRRFYLRTGIVPGLNVIKHVSREEGFFVQREIHYLCIYRSSVHDEISACVLAGCSMNER